MTEVTPRGDHVMVPAHTGTVIAGAIACIVLGGLVVLSNFLPGLADAPPPVGIMVLGSIVLLLGIALLVALPLIRRKRWIEVDPQQLRYVDPRHPGEQWQLNWNDLDAVEIHVGRLPATSMMSRIRPRQRVRLVLYTAGRGRAIEFRALRPSENVAGPGTFAAMFGDSGKMVPELDALLRQYSDGRYRRLLDEGLVHSAL